MMTSPGIFRTGAVFFEWDGSNLNQVPGPPKAPSDSSYYGHMLMLPTGQILFTDFSNDVELYTSTGSPYHWLGSVRSAASAALSRGKYHPLFGYRFNGASQANAYGDDFQDATNYPIVRITNKSTGHVYYCRTHGHNTMAVGYPGPTYTHVDIPANMETGASYLEVVANGIAFAEVPDRDSSRSCKVRKTEVTAPAPSFDGKGAFFAEPRLRFCAIDFPQPLSVNFSGCFAAESGRPALQLSKAAN